MSIRKLLARIFIVAGGAFLLFWIYRIIAIYTTRPKECRERPLDPSIRTATVTKNGKVITYPAHEGMTTTRPLRVVTYNIEGHDQLFDSAHTRKLADAILEMQPDIVGLQEVHASTWQSRRHDQLKELAAMTGLHAAFGPSFSSMGGSFGNAVLTRGEILSTVVHPLPGRGEPRSAMECLIRLDGIEFTFYVTHLVAWDRINASTRREQARCLAMLIRSSRHPYIVTGDFNAGPQSGELQIFENESNAQLCSAGIGITHPRLRQQIDSVWSDYGWSVDRAEVPKIGPSDHWPVLVQLHSS